MSATSFKQRLSSNAKLLCLLFSLILSTTLIACTPGVQYRYLTPKFQSADWQCRDTPKGQLSYDASAEAVSERVTGIAEAGEDCRQQLHRQGEKAKLREEVVTEINADRGEPKRK